MAPHFGHLQRPVQLYSWRALITSKLQDGQRTTCFRANRNNPQYSKNPAPTATSCTREADKLLHPLVGTDKGARSALQSVLFTGFFAAARLRMTGGIEVKYFALRQNMK